MDSTLSVNAAATRKNEVGQKWLNDLQEKFRMALGNLNSMVIPCFN